MFKNFFLAAAVAVVSFSASAASNWSVQPYKNAAVSLAFDMKTFKVTEEGSYGNETLEASVRTRLIHKSPQQLSNGNFYTHSYYTLYVSCQTREYAQVDYAWIINNKLVSKNEEIALSANWKSFTPVRQVYSLSAEETKKYKFADIQATLLCQQVAG